MALARDARRVLGCVDTCLTFDRVNDMDQPPSAAEHPRNHDRLNGWKEIASHFGKSVRTVQRWEKELRLPIHRIHTPNGEIVFAVVAELKQWEAAQSCLPAAEGDEQNGGLAAQPSEVAAGGKPTLGLRPAWRFAVVIAVTAIAAVSLWEAAQSDWWRFDSTVQARNRTQPANWQVEGGKLRVFNAAGVQLWEKAVDRFDPPDFYAKTGTAVLQGNANLVAIDDLDGDGRNEVIFATRSTDRKNEAVICFEHNGNERFEYKPDRVAKYGGVEVHPPPMISPTFVLTADANGRKHIWAQFQNNLNFPSVLAKLSPEGKLLGEYWSNGHIQVLGASRLNGKRVMLVGAAHNETRGASLAVLDYDNLSGSAPAEKPYYRCVDCLPGQPLKFVVFPRGELGALHDERAAPTELRVTPDGEIILSVRLLSGLIPGEPEPQSGVAIYTLSPDLEILQAEHENTYRRFHAHHWQNRNVNHSYGARDENELKQVRVWDGNRFVPLPSNAPRSARNPS
jgi:hypothetical protein